MGRSREAVLVHIPFRMRSLRTAAAADMKILHIVNMDAVNDRNNADTVNVVDFRNEYFPDYYQNESFPYYCQNESSSDFVVLPVCFVQYSYQPYKS